VPPEFEEEVLEIAVSERHTLHHLRLVVDALHDRRVDLVPASRHEAVNVLLQRVGEVDEFLDPRVCGVPEPLVERLLERAFVRVGEQVLQFVLQDVESREVLIHLQELAQAYTLLRFEVLAVLEENVLRPHDDLPFFLGVFRTSLFLTLLITFP